MTSRAGERLSALVTCRTVSVPAERDETEFEKARSLLAEWYPMLHSLEFQLIGPGNLLFRWPGVDSARPIVLMAHYDVVPAQAEQWLRDPFGGEIDEGVVWGRGTLDDKGSVIALCEAVESSLERGIVPAHDVWIALGADEEIMGVGATEVVDALRVRCVEPWLVLDEGGAIVADGIPMMTAAYAMIGVGEKGSVDVEIVARDDAGHASTPTRNGATVRLARAVADLERHQASAHLSEPVAGMLRELSIDMSGPIGWVLRQSLRFSRFTAAVLQHLGPEFDSFVRTSLAVTTMSGSPGRNVIADEARANLNIRLCVDDTIEAALERIRKIVGRHGVEIDRVIGEDPPPVSAVGNGPWNRLVEAVSTTYPGVRAIPYLQTGATDGRHLTKICDAVYRFSPFEMDASQRGAIHGADEWLSVDSLDRGIDFFVELVSTPW